MEFFSKCGIWLTLCSTALLAEYAYVMAIGGNINFHPPVIIELLHELFQHVEIMTLQCPVLFCW
jgi:hypothetical protein